MSSLQIRNLPDDLYQALNYRAERAHRSLAQQTIIELREIVGQQGSVHRRQVLDKIQQDLQDLGRYTPPSQPEDLLRSDRSR
jgi:plasmid stability protein